MIIYIARASGNLNPIIKNVCAGRNWLDNINVFICDINGRKKIVKEFI